MVVFAGRGRLEDFERRGNVPLSGGELARNLLGAGGNAPLRGLRVHTAQKPWAFRTPMLDKKDLVSVRPCPRLEFGRQRGSAPSRRAAMIRPSSRGSECPLGLSC
jgi:hypothetical protein